jgi:hypothetical protein
VLMTELPHVIFSEEVPEDLYLRLTVPLEEDTFRHFLKQGKWEQGGGGVHI